MRKAIFSRLDLNDIQNHKSAMYNSCVLDIASSRAVHRLDNFTQHLNTSRLQHSVNVSYYSFLACKALKLNYKAAARAGLLHDLYHYDRKALRYGIKRHASAHPRAALDNAKEITDLSTLEEDAIVNHMWPMAQAKPRFKESYVVSFVDKYCTCCEVICSCCRIFKRRKGTSQNPAN